MSRPPITARGTLAVALVALLLAAFGAVTGTAARPHVSAGERSECKTVTVSPPNVSPSSVTVCDPIEA